MLALINISGSKDGATVIVDLGAWSKSLLLWRSTTQWLGGMGILVLFVALLSFFKMGGKALFQHESSVQKEHITFTILAFSGLEKPGKDFRLLRV